MELEEGGEIISKKARKTTKKRRRSKWSEREEWRSEGELEAAWRRLTGNGAEVEVVSDDLLVVVVHWALGEAQVEVVPQILVNHPS